MIKAIIFDLDNTLLDFMKMKKIAITAAVEGMVEAGLNVVPSEAYTKIVDLYESGGFVVHFFSEEKIKNLSEGFDVLNIESFEEGTFPRKLFKVILKKKLFIR